MCECFQIVLCQRCCLCVSLKCGALLLFIVQIICLMPFAFHHRNREIAGFAICYIVIFLVDIVILMYIVTWYQPACITWALFLSCGSAFYHFFLICYYSYIDRSSISTKEETIHICFIVVNVVSIATYAYLIFILRNMYVFMVKFPPEPSILSL